MPGQLLKYCQGSGDKEGKPPSGKELPKAPLRVPPLRVPVTQLDLANLRVHVLL